MAPVTQAITRPTPTPRKYWLPVTYESERKITLRTSSNATSLAYVESHLSMPPPASISAIAMGICHMRHMLGRDGLHLKPTWAMLPLPFHVGHPFRDIGTD